MGTIVHHAIIVTSYSEALASRAQALAVELFGHLATPVQISELNGYHTFFIGPDGSKEGWKTGIEYGKRRDKFRASDAVRWCTVVEVAYGGDLERNYLVDSNE